MEKIMSIATRTLFGIAFGVLVIAVFEGLANALGYTIMRGTYTAGRLLELAAAVAIFVVALLLRQIRDQLRAGSGRTS